RVPLQWAGVQHNLGNALRTLGERESDTVRLEEAVIAFGNALKERTRERVPLHWAATQNNLGKALATLGERRGDRALLAEALEAVRNAREIFVEEAGQTHLEDEFEQMLDAIEAALRRVGG
ncbi:MAG: tetratricopeptide repeat protein, partial [Geminicoccaceae bacterium]|nr:tetratricopeptide repeat protein [Geminicoccaceae bacterium]